jgi:peptidyl-prolyl cis-trans isomerase SurA
MKTLKWMIFPLLFAAPMLHAQTKAVVVEEVVARVNNDVITQEDLAKARDAVQGEVQEECRGCTPEQIQQQVATKDKNVLRDLIDQSLLVQRAKDSGITVDADVVKRLDAIRQQAKLPTMEALESEVSKSGQSYEDFKANIRDQLLEQELIRKEVGSRIVISHEEVEKYYNEHKSDFVRPETVTLREIFVSTQGKPDADLPALRKKAEGLRDRVLNSGDDFGELAKHFSDSSTAQQSGELGSFERARLDPAIAEKVFALKRGQMTDVIETKTGFEILQVRERYDAGEQPLDKVDPEITNRLYDQKMEPAMRTYLGTLREDSYVQIKPGYVDTAAVSGNDTIEEVSATSDKNDEKKKAGRKLLIGPKKNSGTLNRFSFPACNLTRTLLPTFSSVKKKSAPPAEGNPTCVSSWVIPRAGSRRACGRVSTSPRLPLVATIS